jgi:GAF domain-containing protein
MHGQLAREFAEMAERLPDLNDTEELLDAVVRLAAPAVGCDHVGLVLCGRRPALRSGRTSDALAAEADQLQIAVRQGPCWCCLARPDGPSDMLVDDTDGESRWPAWNGPVRELGVRSVLTSRVQTADRTVGFLTWYAETPHSFTPELITVAHLVALHASDPLARTLEREHRSGRQAPRSTAPAIHHPVSRPRADHTAARRPSSTTLR